MVDRNGEDGLYRILSLDGGGAKGFYSLGVLSEIEAMIKVPIHERFDLIFGTSTGAIIAALLALGNSVDEIHESYRKYVPVVMKRVFPCGKSASLSELSNHVFGDASFKDVRTDVGIVATKWTTERPMIFKTSVDQAHGRKDSFVPGFGCTVGDAVQASCSAYPFFNRKIVHTAKNEDVELVDGGFCANNPTLYAIADAIHALQIPRERIRIVSIGVGEYPKPRKHLFTLARWLGYLPGVKIAQKIFEINTQSMDQLRDVLFKDVRTVRISEAFTHPEMATDLFEHDLKKLNILWQRGKESFAKNEGTLREYLL